MPSTCANRAIFCAMYMYLIFLYLFVWSDFSSFGSFLIFEVPDLGAAEGGLQTGGRIEELREEVLSSRFRAQGPSVGQEIQQPSTCRLLGFVFVICSHPAKLKCLLDSFGSFLCSAYFLSFKKNPKKSKFFGSWGAFRLRLARPATSLEPQVLIQVIQAFCTA